jgi:2,4-dienoyl-CoA reductase-like NADH-dependent reductase (Old Yellow Enzyme family)/thioredoxin reductase
MTKYPRLLSPIQVGRCLLPNRVIMPSMGTNYADAEGRVTQRMIDYYAARAAGRPGLIVVEAAAVHPSGRVVDFHLMNADSGAVEGLSRLASAITGRGTRTVLQLIHGGRNSLTSLKGDLIAPSAVRGPTGRATPRAMTELEIEAMVDCFARAAARAVAAGFDGVEIHGAHEYLLHQFLTPYCNQRQDGYGGSLEHRVRFSVEVVRAVRQAMGAEPLLTFRLSGDDHVRGGLTPADAADIAGLLEQAGVDLFNVTGGVYETPQMVVPPLPSPPGTHVEAAATVKAAVGVPVSGVGRITNAQQAEEALARVDLVGVGRAQLADPLWLAKIVAGEDESTRPCIGCNQGCIDQVLQGLPIHCVANPWAGRDAILDVQPPAPEDATVVVVGGGVAGMESASTLGHLGYRVVLFEARERLGGQLLLAAVPPGKAEFAGLLRYYQHRLAGMPRVEVRLSTRATVDEVCACNPGAVVVACGSAPVLPPLPGIDEAPIVTGREVLAGRARVGHRTAILGGGSVGGEVAHYLASRGHEVCVIELAYDIGLDLGPARRHLLRRELRDLGVRRYVRAMVRRLAADHVTLVHTAADGTRQLTDVGPVDTFVAALGARPVEELYMALEPKIGHLFLVGDALSPARLDEATAEGARAALAVHAALLADTAERAAG